MLFCRASLLGLVGCLLLCACRSAQFPPAGLFTADTYLRPYKSHLDQPLTIIFGQDIPDAFLVQGAGLKKMEVLNFRKSLRLSLYYTFENSVSDILFSDSIAQEGITLHLYRVRPTWDVKSSRTSTTVVNGNGSSWTYIEYGGLVRYDGMVYRDGEKWLVLDDTVFGEQTAVRTRYGPTVFQDAIREMCEDVYRKLMQPDAKAAH